MATLNKLRDVDSVFVYQMGKVGSSAIESSINNAVHLHNLFVNPPNPPHFRLLYPGGGEKLKYFLKLSFKRWVISRRERVKIITLIRCPFERNVSMFFQALPFWMAEYYSGFGDPARAHTNRAEGIDVLWDCFSKNFNHDYAFEWFDVELRRFTGIDVLSRPRPLESGFTLYQRGKFQVLLMEMDKINTLDAVVGDFIGREINSVASNSGEKKWYRDTYREFKVAYMDRYKQEFCFLKENRYGKWYFGS